MCVGVYCIMCVLFGEYVACIFHIFLSMCKCSCRGMRIVHILTQTHVSNTLRMLYSVSGPPVPQRRETCSLKPPASLERDSPHTPPPPASLERDSPHTPPPPASLERDSSHKRAPPPVKPRTFKPYTDEKFQGLCQKDLV